MRGIELARGFFTEECLPRLRREVPGVLEYLAAGLVGEGSECFGYDDYISRDHDWGPGFCLWLPERCMKQYAVALREILASMPEEYGGFKTRKLVSSPRLGLWSIEAFYSSLIICPGVPQSPEQWFFCPASGLAAAVNGEVFLDNLGEFTAVRNSLLGFYPEDIRLWLLAKRCALAAQTGQYNYLRCLRHGETATAEIIKGRFAENAMAALFLLEKKYMPFYKWSLRALRELPEQSSAARTVESIMNARGYEAIEPIQSLSAQIISRLGAEGLSGGESSFLMDHCGSIMGKIKDEAIRRKGITLDF